MHHKRCNRTLTVRRFELQDKPTLILRNSTSDWRLEANWLSATTEDVIGANLWKEELGHNQHKTYLDCQTSSGPKLSGI